MIGDIIMNVSEKIRYYRELRGLTQQQLADFSGIPLGTLKNTKQVIEIPNKNLYNALLMPYILVSPLFKTFI